MKQIKKLKGKKSSWSEDADYRIRNRKWLRYSSNIARRVLAAIEDTENLSQKVLAEKIDVSVQYVNKMLKGQQNLTLETIAKLSDAVGTELISFPEYKYSRPADEEVFSIHTASAIELFHMYLLSQEAIQLTQHEFHVNSNARYKFEGSKLNSIFNAVQPAQIMAVNSARLPAVPGKQINPA